KRTSIALAAAALVASMMASPVMAQTITSPGLIGPTACVGTGETDDPLTGTISAVQPNQVTLAYDARDNLYSALRSQLGDGGATSFPLRYRVYNARTNSQTGSEGGFATISSGSPNLASGNSVSFSLSEKTPYYIAIYSTASGFGESRPLLRRCFMTGGTYTPSNESGQPGFVNNTTSGCFSISPRTPQDVRNCLCGRSSIWDNATRNTETRTALGCAS
ncbi:MAG: hypothetical protein OXC65_02375, partial [Thiotrichales bacterium]|nr:hypothetical protein [Thiotrichales bacterium]